MSIRPIFFTLTLFGVLRAESAPLQSEADPSFRAELQRAIALLDEGRLEDALAAFRDANSRVGNSSAECHLGMAHAYQRLGKHKDALEASDRALEHARSDGHRFEAHNLKGVVLQAMDAGSEEARAS